MFKIGDRVKEKGRGRVLEVINKFDDKLVLKELNTNDLKIIVFNESQVELHIENTIKGEKTKRIKRINTLGVKSIIEWECNKKNNTLVMRIEENPIDMNTLTRILLHDEEILNHKYERISPFKVSREFKKMESHIWNIEFVNIRNNNLEKTEIIRTDKDMMLMGEYEVFLPDFLEVCVERGLLCRDKTGYKLIYDISRGICDCEYIQPKKEFTIGELKNSGFVIPEKYEEQFNLFA